MNYRSLFLVCALFLGMSSESFAQQQKSQDELPESIFVNPRPTNSKPEDSFWFQVTIPSANIGPFPVKKQDEVTKDTGVSAEFGWQPWIKTISQNDSQLVKLLKSGGVSVGYTKLNGGDFPDFLATLWTVVDNVQDKCYNEVEDGKDAFGDTRYKDVWNGKCKPCPDVAGRYCTSKDVYTRDTYIKYAESSISIGFYIPYTIGRLTMLGGTNLRMHFIKEGIRTDQLKDSTEYSASVVLGMRLRLTKHFGLVATAEQSFAGFDYRQVSGGMIVTW